MQKKLSRTAHATLPPLVLEAEIRQPQRDCAIYGWDREHAFLQAEGVHHAAETLPADLAIVLIEQQVELPVLVLTPVSLQSGVHVQVRVLGAIHPSQEVHAEDTLLLTNWLLIAVAELGTASFPWQTREQLPAPLWATLMAYAHAKEDRRIASGSKQALTSCDAETVQRTLREARLYVKRQRRLRQRPKGWHPETEPPADPTVSWQIIKGLSAEDRHRIQQGVPSDTALPHARAEHLIRQVPVRFQQALSTLLLADERVLAFVERPALYQRAGIFGLRRWHAHAGLLLVTDRQVLWLCDVFAPGDGSMHNGYVAHTLPLERLLHTWLLPPGKVLATLVARLGQSESSYVRLVVEVDSQHKSEFVVIEFPSTATSALTEIMTLLSPFLVPSLRAETRTLRRLPQIDVWQPQGAEAERLAGLGGTVSVEVVQRLEQQCAALLTTYGEECLVRALVPALEAYQSPARLIALTWTALLIIEEGHKRHQAGRVYSQESALSVQRYDRGAISSIQLRYSLMGSGLHLALPQLDGQVKHLALPFHSPAIAWFLPLYTRLRLLLGLPYPTEGEHVDSHGKSGS